MTATCSPARRQPRKTLNTKLTDAGLGAVIRAERQRQHLHQDALAASAGIDAKVFSRIERGERPLRVSELAAIASGLGVTSEELLIRAQHQHRFAAKPPKN